MPSLPAEFILFMDFNSIVAVLESKNAITVRPVLTYPFNRHVQ